MSVEQGPIWCAGQRGARPLDRRAFLGSIAAATVALAATPSEPFADGGRAYIVAHPALHFNKALYEAMWGSSEFVATGSLRTYNGEPSLAKLDGPHTLFIDGQYDEARPATLGAFAARVPGAEFAVIPGGTHGFLSDRPQEALGIIRPWLDRQGPA